MAITRYAHQDDFARIAERFARLELLELLGIAPATLKRWLQGRTRIPWAAFRLAHELSDYGLLERDAAEGFNRRCLAMEAAALRDRVAVLELELVRQARAIRWACANDPFVWPTDPRSISAAATRAPIRAPDLRSPAPSAPPS